MESPRQTNELLSLDYDYLRIAHHYARLAESETGAHKAWDAAVIACVFGTLSVDAMFNDLWTSSGRPREPASAEPPGNRGRRKRGK